MWFGLFGTLQCGLLSILLLFAALYLLDDKREIIVLTAKDKLGIDMNSDFFLVFLGCAVGAALYAAYRKSRPQLSEQYTKSFEDCLTTRKYCNVQERFTSRQRTFVPTNIGSYGIG